MRYTYAFLAVLAICASSGIALATAADGQMQGMNHTSMSHEKTTPGSNVDAKRQRDVSQRGQTVMPFNLTQTQHVFHKDSQGGVQQVLVRERSNGAQVKLIREHLQDIRAQFLQGNFSDPAAIHGKGMPGLADLERAKPGDITIDYQDLPDGGQLAFRSRHPRLIGAIHRWFDAQVSDHGRDASAR